MLLHHKPMLIDVQKGVKNETIAMLFVQNTGCLDFQRHQNAQFTPSSFLVQEFTKGILLSFFRTKKKERKGSLVEPLARLTRTKQHGMLDLHATQKQCRIPKKDAATMVVKSLILLLKE